MALLIDGYNLLHACGILGRGIGPGSLERSRNALLNFLAESISERELSRTTVVFDAREAPPGLPRQLIFRGIRVRFAERGSDADELIEELIASDTAPRRLTVVSSDHRLHRAARRRRATAIDSDRWYAEILRARIERSRATQPANKPGGALSEVEVRYWLRIFGLEPEEPPKPPVVRPEASSAPPETKPEPPWDNPFPPGYAEDISEEDV
jgi:predicted RNA-binding protein with PIN domain